MKSGRQPKSRKMSNGAEPPQTGPSNKSTFRVLVQRNFWPYFSGNLLSNCGTFLQNMALALLVYRLTGSPLLVGVVGFAQFIAVFLLAPWSGPAADRFDRRRLLIITQIGAAILTAVLAVLWQAGLASVWVIILLALLVGITTAFATPAMQALVPLLVARRDLPAAIALNSVTFNLARAIGPATGAFVIATLGFTWAFSINTLSYVALIAALFFVRPGGYAVSNPGAQSPANPGADPRMNNAALPEPGASDPAARNVSDSLENTAANPGAPATNNPRAQTVPTPSGASAASNPGAPAAGHGQSVRLRDSLRLVRDNVRLAALLMVVVAVSLTQDPVVTLSPAIATNVFGQDTLTGIFIGIFGAGAVAAAFTFAPRAAREPRWILLTMLLVGAGVAGYTLSGIIGLTYVSLAVGGFGFLSTVTAATTLLQLMVEDRQRGRIMALWSMGFLGTRPIGSLIDGAIASVAGFRIAGLVMILPTLAAMAFLAAVLRREGLGEEAT